MRRSILFPLLMVAFALIFAPSSLRGNTSPPVPQPPRSDSREVEITGLKIGFDGHYRVGCWTPVKVDYRLLAFHGGKLAVIVPDGDGVPVRYEQGLGPHNLPTSVTFLVRFGRVSGPLRVEYKPTADESTPTVRDYSPDELPRAILETQRLVLSLGPSVGVEQAAQRARRNENDPEQTIVALLPPEYPLPTDARAYEGVAAVVAPTGPESLLLKTRPDQKAAIEQWVRGGGRLVLSCASQSDELFGSNGRLLALAPGKLAGRGQQRVTAALETFVAATEPIAEASRRTRVDEGLSLSLWRDVDGRVDVQERATEGFRPVIVRRPHGLGLVVFFSADLDLPPLAEWKDRSQLVWKLTQIALGEQNSADLATTHEGQIAHVGYDDLAGQMSGALDQFAGVSLIGFFWIAALIVGYLLLVGPIDYFVLRGTIRQMEFTWVTFPLAVVACCALAWALANWSKGDAVRVNQLEIVDVDLVTQPGKAEVHGHWWAHLYSPSTARFDLSLAPQTLRGDKNEGASEWLSWEGMPGDGFGGMQTPQATLGDDPGYANRGRPDESQFLAGVPIAAGGTKSLTGSWQDIVNMPRAAGKLVDSPGGAPVGDVVNPFEFALDDCRLVYERWVCSFGRLEPGERRKVEGANLGEFSYRLTRRKVTDSKQVQEIKYDQASFDVERIAEMLMFHESAGGRGHTKLWNRYQPNLDLTLLARSGRAILFGRVAAPAAKLQRDGKPLLAEGERHWTWYRIVLPVAAASSSDAPE